MSTGADSIEGVEEDSTSSGSFMEDSIFGEVLLAIDEDDGGDG